MLRTKGDFCVTTDNFNFIFIDDFFLFRNVCNETERIDVKRTKDDSLKNAAKGNAQEPNHVNE